VTGNVSMAAGGAMDFLAGAAGVVKAVAETMAVVDPDNAEKYKAIAEKAGHVQLAFEIAGAVVDVTSAISHALITKVVPSVTKEVLKEGAEKVLVEAVKSGSKDAVAASAKAIGKEVAAKVAGDIAEQLGKTALDASKNTVAKELAKTIGVRQLMEAFSREAIEEMVTKTVQKVATEAMESGGEITAKALTKKITRELTYEVTKAVMKASAFTALNVVRGATGGASKVVSGVIEIERAKLQKQIELLMLDQQWLQILLDEFEQRKKETVEKTKELIDGQANAVQGGSDALKQTYGTKIQGVASLARVATATA
jgi:secreted effector protein SseC